MQKPGRKKAARRNINCAAGDSERFARRAFPHFPNKSVVIKVQQSRRGDDTHERTLKGVYSDKVAQVTKRAVSENETDIQTDERSAAPKHETHETDDVAIILHRVAVEEPNERAYLQVV